MQLTNVSIEVAPGHFLVGGTYEENSLFQNLDRFKYYDGDGVLSLQGNYPNGDVLVWTREEGATILRDPSSRVNSYQNHVNVKNQNDLIGTHVIDKSGDWGHGVIKSFIKDNDQNVVAMVNFPINADQGWEIQMLPSQIKKLPAHILLQGFDANGNIIIDEMDITNNIMSLNDFDDIISIEDSVSSVNSVLGLGLDADKVKSIRCVDSICAYFAKQSNSGKIPEDLVDDGVMKQLKVLNGDLANTLNMERKL